LPRLSRADGQLRNIPLIV
jgi:predicted nucleotidyltransferase